jgi:predicted amidohydrolase
VRIAAAQTVEFRENVDAALNCVADFAARAASAGASLLCFPEGFLQGYLTDEERARHNAFDLSSPAFETVLKQLPKTGCGFPEIPSFGIRRRKFNGPRPGDLHPYPCQECH